MHPHIGSTFVTIRGVLSLFWNLKVAVMGVFHKVEPTFRLVELKTIFWARTGMVAMARRPEIIYFWILIIVSFWIVLQS